MTGHHPNQWWPISATPYGVTFPRHITLISRSILPRQTELQIYWCNFPHDIANAYLSVMCKIMHYRTLKWCFPENNADSVVLSIPSYQAGFSKDSTLLMQSFGQANTFENRFNGCVSCDCKIKWCNVLWIDIHCVPKRNFTWVMFIVKCFSSQKYYSRSMSIQIKQYLFVYQ